MAKDPGFKGVYYGNIDPIGNPKGGSITIARRIKGDKTQNFLNASSAKQFGVNGVVKPTGGQQNFPSDAKNKKVVYETLTIPMPVYLTMMYTVTIQAEYQQQMNEILEPFASNPGGINYFIAKKDGYNYECFIDADFGTQNNVSNLAEDRRQYISAVNIKTLGYIIGSGKNQETPKIAIPRKCGRSSDPKRESYFR